MKIPDKVDLKDLHKVIVDRHFDKVDCCNCLEYKPLRLTLGVEIEKRIIELDKASCPEASFRKPYVIHRTPDDIVPLTEAEIQEIKLDRLYGRDKKRDKPL